MVKWGYISQGWHPKVIARSYQGHSKVKSAQSSWKYIVFDDLSTIMFTLIVYDGLKLTYTLDTDLY